VLLKSNKSRNTVAVIDQKSSQKPREKVFDEDEEFERAIKVTIDE
jgi:hypothetical protein